jgi:hypothetical protein
MERQAISQSQKPASMGSPLSRGGILQRKCDCGQQVIGGGECGQCRKQNASTQHRTVNLFPSQKNSIYQSNLSEFPPVVHEVFNSSGQPLDPETRTFMESRFGHYDFSQVRIHTDHKAAESSRALNASAFTHGKHIAFSKGRYRPETLEGKRLLSHELAHVVQQSRCVGSSGNKKTLSPSAESRLEKSADDVAEVVVSGSQQNNASSQIHYLLNNIPRIEAEGLVQYQQESTAHQSGVRYDLTFRIRNLTLRSLSSEETMEALLAHRRLLLGLLQMERRNHRSYRQIRGELGLLGPIVEFASDPLSGGIELPSEDIWIKPEIALDEAQYTLNAGYISESINNLVRAERSFIEARDRLGEYTSRLGSGLTRTELAAEGTILVAGISVVVVTGGAAAAPVAAGGAGAGLLGVAAVTGLTAGTFGVIEEEARQGGEILAGLRDEFDVGAIFQRGTIAAVTTFVGALTGGFLSNLFKRLFISRFLTSISDDMLQQMGREMGLGGALSREALLTPSRLLLADFLGGIASSPFVTAVTTGLESFSEGSRPSREEFVNRVLDELWRGGIVQLFLGVVTHAYSRRAAARTRRTSPSRASSPTAPSPPEVAPPAPEVTGSLDAPVPEPTAPRPSPEVIASETAPSSPEVAPSAPEVTGTIDAPILEPTAPRPSPEVIPSETTPPPSEVAPSALEVTGSIDAPILEPTAPRPSPEVIASEITPSSPEVAPSAPEVTGTIDAPILEPTAPRPSPEVIASEITPSSLEVAPPVPEVTGTTDAPIPEPAALTPTPEVIASEITPSSLEVAPPVPEVTGTTDAPIPEPAALTPTPEVIASETTPSSTTHAEAEGATQSPHGADLTAAPESISPLSPTRRAEIEAEVGRLEAQRTALREQFQGRQQGINRLRSDANRVQNVLNEMRRGEQVTQDAQELLGNFSPEAQRFLNRSDQKTQYKDMTNFLQNRMRHLRSRAEQLERSLSPDLNEQARLSGQIERLRNEGMFRLPTRAGGRYSTVFEKNNLGGEVNHIPPFDAYRKLIPLSRREGPSIWMTEADHQNTSSWGASDEAVRYRDNQRELIRQGRFMEAVQMDINDIRTKFRLSDGTCKYELGIQQMLLYVQGLSENLITSTHLTSSVH